MRLAYSLPWIRKETRAGLISLSIPLSLLPLTVALSLSIPRPPRAAAPHHRPAFLPRVRIVASTKNSDQRKIVPSVVITAGASHRQIPGETRLNLPQDRAARHGALPRGAGRCCSSSPRPVSLRSLFSSCLISSVSALSVSIPLLLQVSVCSCSCWVVVVAMQSWFPCKIRLIRHEQFQIGRASCRERVCLYV